MATTAALVFLPALHGPFLLDDDPNLGVLINGRAERSAAGFLAFTFGGESSITGRPIAMASFAADYLLWGAEPGAMRGTNLVLHLLNGLLLFLLTRRLLARVSRTGRTATVAALAAATVWLLHPLNASTTLYVVQRMTQLSALFTLLGLLAYLHGRTLWGTEPRRATAWLVLGLGGCTLLAGFSKENGFLLPLYAGVLEITLLGQMLPLARGPARTLLHLVLASPLAAFAAYAALYVLPKGAIHRDFNLGERLLTEGRVLVEYLGQILFPRTSQLGLFHDDFPFSTGLFSPPSTALALAGVAALLFTALWLRRRAPVFALGVLWFFAGHLVESTVIPLELYFEHRNYLPMVGPLLALAYYTANTITRLREGRHIAGAAVMLFIAAVGVATIRAWQSPLELSLLWAHYHPASVRAQQFALQQWLAAGRPTNGAFVFLGEIERLDPDSVSTRFLRLQLECAYRKWGVSEQAVEAARRASLSGGYTKALYGGTRNLTETVLQKGCKRLDARVLLELLHNLRSNPRLQQDAVQALSWEAEAMVHLHRGDIGQLVAAVDHALAIDPNLDRYLWRARLAAAEGDSAAALTVLADARKFLTAAGWPETMNDYRVAEAIEQLETTVSR